jgi:hypothetical protein
MNKHSYAHCCHGVLLSRGRQLRRSIRSNHQILGHVWKRFAAILKHSTILYHTVLRNALQTAGPGYGNWSATKMYTVDASVWLREATPSDPMYHLCHTLLGTLRQKQIELYEPWLLLAEVAGPIGRLLRDPLRGRIYADIVASFPNTIFVEVNRLYHDLRTRSRLALL